MMLGYMHEWVEDFGHKKKSVLKRLTKESVKEHKNVLRKGESGVSQALVNPLGLPTLEDLKPKQPPRSVKSAVAGTYGGKPIYFSREMYGKGGDTSPVTGGMESPSPYASPYSPPSVGSEASSQDQQHYMWTAGLSREGESFASGSTEDFYSAEKSSSLPAYGPPPGPPQSTEAFYSARPDPRRSVTEGYAPPQWGPSRAAQDFYSSPGPTPPQSQSPALGPPQQPGGQASRNPFLRQMNSPQPQSRGMDFYAQGSQQSPKLSYNPYPPQNPQISSEAASFYASPPPQPPQHGSRSEKEGQTDPLAELSASLRKF